MTNRIVTKELAGIEDLLLGTGNVNQTRAGSSVPITKIDAENLIYENAETLRVRFGKKVDVLTNVAELQALATSTAAETFIYLLGYTTAGDGGGGLFWLDSSDTSTVEDLNIVFSPDVLANGRWKRVDTDNYMSPDRGDASYTIQAFDFGIQLYTTTLTADRTITLPTAGLYKGKQVTVSRTAGGAFDLLVGAVTTLVASGTVTLVYDGVAWVVLASTVSASLTTVIYEIGGWDMDVSEWMSVPHFIDETKVRRFTVTIQNNSGNIYDFTADHKAGQTGTSSVNIQPVVIQLRRATGGGFDVTTFNGTSINRGWVVIDYET